MWTSITRGTSTSQSTPSTDARRPLVKMSDVTAFLESNPDAGINLFKELRPDVRRRLLVAGGALEYFGRDEIEKELNNADLNRDTIICREDFRNWYQKAVERSTKDSEETKDKSSASSAHVPPVPLPVLIKIALITGVPFIGFGFLDNSLMILAGDAIDSTLGFYFNVSVMASAAMGNVVSGTIGMQVHGVLDRLFAQIGITMPRLTHEQMELRSVFLAGHMGSTFGVAFGLSLGMLPLLFVKDHDEKAADKLWAQIDVNNDGKASIDELHEGAQKFGISITREEMEQTVRTRTGGKDGAASGHDYLTKEEFILLYKGAHSKVT